VISDSSGNLYGTTTFANSNGGFGVVFELDASGTYTTLYTFTGGADGGNPFAGVTRDSAGNLYGTTFYNGNASGQNNGMGVVFKLDSTGNFNVLHTFAGPDGANPRGVLVLDRAGNLYGTAEKGGSGKGTVFKLDPAGNFTVLHTFTGADGAAPAAGVIRDTKGNLYGTTYGGGANNAGAVFRLSPKGRMEVLYSFKKGVVGGAGSEPASGVVRDAVGNLYGATSLGGRKCDNGNEREGCGAVYRLSPAGEIFVFRVLNAGTGSNPAGDLVRFKGYV
jgi:uncharacterized repeat protein (TIGR03803 family)